MDNQTNDKYPRNSLIPADTHADAYIRQRQIWFGKSPGERFCYGAQMTDDAKALFMAGLRIHFPGLTPLEQKIRWFKNWYGKDFSEIQLQEIVDAFSTYEKKGR